jgi:hypothetical protein
MGNLVNNSGYQVSGSTPYTGVGTTQVHFGLNATYTTNSSGRLLLLLTGTAQNTGAQITNLFGRYGTGTAPVQGAAAAGSNWGGTAHVAGSGDGDWIGFTIMAVLTGLTISQTYWFDIILSSAGGATAGVRDLQFTALEF